MTQTSPASRRGNRTTMLVAGTAVIILAAGVGYQIYQANSVAAVTEQSPGETAGAARVDKTLARVNGYAISYDLVARECFDRLGVEVLDNIINRVLIEQACQKQGISVSKAEVHNEINQIAQRFQMPVDTWYQLLQTERGLNQTQYQSDVIWPMLALRKLAGGDIQVSQEDMQKAFERDYGRMVKSRMIMFNNLRRAQEAHEKARRFPDQFDKLAEEYSIEPNSRSLGGVIPHIRRHSGNPVMEQAAFKLQPGEVSGIIEIDAGHFIILKCEGFTDPIVKDMVQVKDDLYEQVKEEKTQTAVARVFESIRKEAQVDNYLTQKSTGSPIKPVSGFQSPSDVRPASVQQPNSQR